MKKHQKHRSKMPKRGGSHCRWPVLLILALVCIAPSPLWGGEIVDRIVAVVNDEIITLYDLNRAVKPYQAKIERFGYDAEKESRMLEKARQDLLDQLIDRTLTDQEVKRLEIKVSDKEINQSIARIKNAQLLSDEELQIALDQQGMTMGAYRQNIRDQILRAKLINREIKSKIVISAEEIEAYYKAHEAEYRGQRKYHLRNIIMIPPAGADEAAKNRVRQKMELIIEKLKQGEPFDELAKAYSQSPLAAEGGDLGVFAFEQLAPVIQAAIDPLKAGQFTPILETDQGYQIFWVDAIIWEKGRPLEEVSAEIQNILYQKVVDEKFNTWIADLRQRSSIQIIQ